MKEISFCGHQLVLHPSGALYWPQHRMLVVADLHLEKGSFYACKGYFLPPYDSHKTLVRLLEVAEALDARTLLMLGDCFHDARGYDRLGDSERHLFAKLLNLKPLWIRGNHDGAFVPPGFTGYDYYKLDTLHFHHQAKPDGFAEISGHYHPKVDLVYQGSRLFRPCFIEDGRRLILPAFGAYTGGLSVDDPAISSLFTQPARVYLLGEGRVFKIDSGLWQK